MTAEQLAELLGQCRTMEGRWWKVERGLGRPTERMVAQDFLKHLAPSLARRVIAAEKLVEALEQCLGEMTGNMDGDLREDRDGRDMAREALTAYREASK